MLTIISHVAIQPIEHKRVLEQSCRLAHLFVGVSAGQSICQSGG